MPTLMDNMSTEKKELAPVLQLNDTDALVLKSLALSKALLESQQREFHLQLTLQQQGIEREHAEWAEEFCQRQDLDPAALGAYDFDINSKTANRKKEAIEKSNPV